ncbi:MFS transporter [Rhodococcus sp. 06-235-1A]|uniref:MFS transporter n=1 Tax=Rhodococcus sp. 06-235-1A TaxID=2022508 RepID=UPI0015C65912|nr:MFS transporter [Rhodococcus sp. 06-235-1A]
MNARPLRKDTSGLGPVEESALRPDAEDAEQLSVAQIAIFVIANLFAWTAILTPMAITLALKIREMNPDGAGTALSIVAAVGAAVAIFANPIFGRLSDRTRSKFGRRRPWMVVGIVGGAVGLTVVTLADEFVMVVVGWTIAQSGMQALLAAVTALLPDKIPARQRGRVGGLIGMGQSAATTVGSGLIALNPESPAWGFLAPMVLAGIAVAALCAVLPDRKQPSDNVPKLSVRELASSFWTSPRRYPDFGWMWISRLAVFMGVTFLLTYQAYFLLARVGIDPTNIATVMFAVLLLENAMSIGSNLFAGWLSDRLQIRKPFVTVAALVAATGMVVAGLAHSLTAFFLGVAIYGLGKGTYVAVDLALASELLPQGDEDAGKNMGLFTVASLAPSLLAPALATVLLATGDPGQVPGAPEGNFQIIFFAAAVFMVVGAIAIRPIKGTR